MIHSKPKSNTLFSLVAFLIIIGGLIIGLFIAFGFSSVWLGLVYITLIMIFVFVFYRLLLSRQQVWVGKGRIEIKAFGKMRRYPIKAVESWHQEIMDVNKQQFKQLEIVFQDQFRIKLSSHEHSDYGEILSYLKKKLKSKKRT